MKFDLKRLPRNAIDTALAKVERYRLLHEPREAESICLDVLEIEPDHQQALVWLLLSLTDQFGRSDDAGRRAEAILPRLESAYHRAYYAGIICERHGKERLRAGAIGAGPVAYDWLRQAMGWYEKAEPLRPAGSADPLIRWNACARIIMRNEHVRPAPDETEVSLQLE